MNVEYLKLGLYVSRLDRPWGETPFLFQGFTVQDQDELAQLRSLCRKVYVEVSAAEAEELRALGAPCHHLDGKFESEKTARYGAVKHPALEELTKDLTTRQLQVPIKDSIPLKSELTTAKTVAAALKIGKEVYLCHGRCF